MQEILLGEGALLSNGVLSESGYAPYQIKVYERSAVKVRNRLIERDSYCFGDGRYSVTVTVTSKPHSAEATVSLFDLLHIRHITKRSTVWVKTEMPSSCNSGNIAFSSSDAEISVTANKTQKQVRCMFKKFDGKDPFCFEFTADTGASDNLTVALPLKNNGFAYATKQCFAASGRIESGKTQYAFKNCFGSLDWLRAVPEKLKNRHTATLVCDAGGLLGITLADGIGNAATENAVLYNGRLNKLGRVTFSIPFTNGEPDHLKPWKMADDSDRLSLLFYPLIDRQTKSLRTKTETHTVFGKFYGKATLDDGSIITLTDKHGYAEHIKNGI